MPGRVCHIRQSTYPNELSVRREAEALRLSGYEVHVITQEDPENPGSGTEEISGVTVHRIPVTRRRRSLGRYLYDYANFFLRAAWLAGALHRRHPFDVVQVNTMPDFLVYAALWPRLHGAKVLLTMQEPVPELWETLRGRKPPRILALAEQRAIAWADHVVTMTPQMKAAFVARGADPGKISVVLVVPDMRFLEGGFAPRRPEEFVLISHGTIEKRYGHSTMLRAVAAARREVPGLRLRIPGQGTHLPELLRLRRELGLNDCVNFLSWIPQTSLTRELRSADAGVVAQVSSPYAHLVHTQKMFELVALGKPLLISRLRAVEAAFSPEEVHFFEPGDAGSLAEGIVALYRAPAERAARAERAQRRFAAYRWEVQREIYLGVIRKLCEGG